ncbi:nucleotidyltransferase domain-containing protein [bacterium]|nr:nucleotidyltransferase domain-containing protein [bacterium]MBU1599919.1 nucleotidyltransferase domain-containing protein [bacterium]MBU2461254.1 nucleotidyltransferase domain-containing protein [bacterium]
MKLHREDEILKNVVNILNKNLKPHKIILFGGRAKNSFFKNSDFDVAVDIERPEISQRRKIREEIEEVCGLYKVDLVFLMSVDERFKNIILRTGKVIYEREG